MLGEELKLYKNTLRLITYSLSELISNKNFEHGVKNILKEVTSILDVDYVSIFETHLSDNELSCSVKFQHTKNDTSAQANKTNYQKSSNDPYCLKIAIDLSNNKTFEGVRKDFTRHEIEVLEAYGVETILLMPIFYENDFFGFIRFDDYKNERVWNNLEKSILKTIANAFIAALSKDNYFKKLEKIIELQLEEIQFQNEIIHKQASYVQKGEMLNMIAHQWRQPLNAISGAAIDISLQNSLGTLDKDKIEEVSQYIQSEAQEMSSIIDDFMELNKPDSKKDFFIYEAVNEVKKMIYPQLKNRAIFLEIEIDNSLNIYHNLKTIVYVLINLITNARDAFESRKHTENKKIKIFTTSDKTSIKLIVEDNAGGITEEIKYKMFHPYFTTKEPGKGTGIGLYMSKKMLESVPKCTISVDTSGNNTQFILTFDKGSS